MANNLPLCKCGCGNHVSRQENSYLRGHNTRNNPARVERIRRTCLEKYGVENISQLAKIKQKIKKKLNEKTPEEKKKIVRKRQKTSLKNYGVDNPSKSEIVKNRKVKTSKLNWGTENPFQNEEVKRKYKRTVLRRYGVDSHNKLSRIKEKKKETCLKHFGVDSPFKDKNIQKRIRKTMVERYGVEYSFQSKELREKSKKTCLEHFGVDSFGKSEKGKKISRENFIKLVEEQKLNGEPLVPRIGPFERECLDSLEKNFDITIERNKRIGGYFPDGYIKELNLIVEFDEEHHKWKSIKKRDLEKDRYFCNLGFNIFRIKKDDWLANNESVLKEFKKKLEIAND